MSSCSNKAKIILPTLNYWWEHDPNLLFFSGQLFFKERFSQAKNECAVILSISQALLENSRDAFHLFGRARVYEQLHWHSHVCLREKKEPCDRKNVCDEQQMTWSHSLARSMQKSRVSERCDKLVTSSSLPFVLAELAGSNTSSSCRLEEGSSVVVCSPRGLVVCLSTWDI